MTMQEYHLENNLTIIHYSVREDGEWGNDLLWDKLVKNIKMPIWFKIKNIWNEIKIRSIRSCKKRMEFFTKKYKNNIDETH